MLLLDFFFLLGIFFSLTDYAIASLFFSSLVYFFLVFTFFFLSTVCYSMFFFSLTHVSLSAHAYTEKLNKQKIQVYNKLSLPSLNCTYLSLIVIQEERKPAKNLHFLLTFLLLNLLSASLTSFPQLFECEWQCDASCLNSVFLDGFSEQI